MDNGWGTAHTHTIMLGSILSVTNNEQSKQKTWMYSEVRLRLYKMNLWANPQKGHASV